MRDYEQQTWRPQPTCISALQHFVTSAVVVAVAVALSGRSTERPLEDAAGNRLMKAAEEPSERLHAASPHHGLYIRLTKWQSSREEASQHPFQMGTVTPNGQCDASAEPEHTSPTVFRDPRLKCSCTCSRGQCCTARNLGPVGGREITSVSVSPP